jgi:hydroxymethylpyrimidine/phosphomethylpyrimidine kinase
MKKALTIGGFDPWGGAGITADLKTFSELGVYGLSVITSIVPQNTTKIFSVIPVSESDVRSQFRPVKGSAKFCKVSLIPSPELVKTVANLVEGMKIVLDPIVRAGTGRKLVSEGVLDELKSKLFPNTYVITPNIHEAETITGMKIRSEADQKRACKVIHRLGPKYVVIKGGHLNGKDVLYDGKEYVIFKPTIRFTGRIHGTGCRYASCLCAELAKGRDVTEACMRAKDFAEMSIRNAVSFGKGKDANEARSIERKKVLDRLSKAAAILERSSVFWKLIPEVQTNIGECIPCPDDHGDVGAIPGRLVRSGKNVKASSIPAFGASKHISSLILSAYSHERVIKACMNIRYDPEIVNVCKGLGLRCVEFSRRDEPVKVKKKEGSSLVWGLEQAIRKNRGKVPDVVFDKGEVGKEAMVRIFGKNALDVAKIALKVAEEYEKTRR